MEKKVYKCDKCGKLLGNKKPIRYIKQEYYKEPFPQYRWVKHYDLCNECNEKLKKWFNG